MSEWFTFDHKPDRPMPVLLYHANWTWRHPNGSPCEPNETRDPADRTLAGWFDGDIWHEAGTAHDAFESDDSDDHPTHWTPLIVPPVTP